MCKGLFQDNRIRFIRNHRDFISTLNRGLEESKEDYIARMDADDIMLPHRLQTQHDFLKSHPEIDVCGSWAETFGQVERAIQMPTTHLSIAGQLLLGNAMIHPAVMMKKASLNKINYSLGYPYAEDYKLWTDMVLKGLRFANIPEILLKYRISGKQVTQTHSQEMINSVQKVRLEYIEQIMEKLQERDERYAQIFDTLINAVNEQLISFDSLCALVRQIYIETPDINNSSPDL